MNDQPVFDREGALERVEQDRELYAELVTIFMEEYDSEKARVASALEAEDGEAVEHAAHSMKSALGNIGAMQCFALAKDLEFAGKAGEIEKAKEILPGLLSAIATFLDVVKAEFQIS